MSAPARASSPSPVQPSPRRPRPRPSLPVGPENQQTRNVVELIERMAPLAATAVDPLEIAAVLEADGITDRAAQLHYGAEDVFTLADLVYQRVPRRVPPVVPDETIWCFPWTRAMLNSLLYTAPAVGFLPLTPLLGHRPTLLAVGIVTVAGWSASLAVSYLGYAALAGGGPAAARVLRNCGLAGLLVLAGGLAAAVWRLGLPPAGAAAAGGLGVYVLAATVALVCGARLWLAAALTPATFAGVGYLITAGHWGWVWAGSLTTAVTTLVLAVVLVSVPRSQAAGLMPRAAWRDASAHGLFGLLAAGLVLVPTLSEMRTGRSLTATAVLTAALTLSMGAAEAGLYRYRRAILRLLCRTHTIKGFAGGSVPALLAAVGTYLGVLGGLVALAAVGGSAASLFRPSHHTVMLGAAVVALGGALFVALLLLALGSRYPPLIVLAAALAVNLGVLAGSGTALDSALAPAVTAATLFAVLLAWAGIWLANPLCHQ